ncbi:MAG: hypothetical protein ACI8QT_001728 [Halioglobus sp.]|jgi:hypothetical protein
MDRELLKHKTRGIRVRIWFEVRFPLGYLQPTANAALLSGGIFGDHASPISNTTIVASIGTKYNRLDPVTTQSIAIADAALPRKSCPYNKTSDTNTTLLNAATETENTRFFWLKKPKIRIAPIREYCLLDRALDVFPTVLFVL